MWGLFTEWTLNSLKADKGMNANCLKAVLNVRTDWPHSLKHDETYDHSERKDVISHLVTFVCYILFFTKFTKNVSFQNESYCCKVPWFQLKDNYLLNLQYTKKLINLSTDTLKITILWIRQCIASYCDANNQWDIEAKFRVSVGSFTGQCISLTYL